MRTAHKARRRPYLVARASSCVLCRAHDWRAFAEPQERDLMSPCTLVPIYMIWATTKREAIAQAKERFVKGDDG